jgi:uncharacterized protein (TIGR02145 family)
MQDNLNTTKYNNGKEITDGSDSAMWVNMYKGAYCNYNNDEKNAMIYGRLYNWYTVNDSLGLCPSGWHVPTDGEWQTLVDNQSGNFKAGGKLKSLYTIDDGYGLWASPNQGGYNDSGFTGLPGGYRANDARSYDQSYNGYWWSKSANIISHVNYGWGRYFNYDDITVYRNWFNVTFGFSVRCLKN